MGGFMIGFTEDEDASEWGVTVEIAVPFASGAVSVLVTSFLCMRLNMTVPMYVQVARHAGLRYPEIGGMAKDVCADLTTEHSDINPVRVLFMPATPTLLSFFWSYILIITGIFFARLSQFCPPGFDSACKST